VPAVRDSERQQLVAAALASRRTTGRHVRLSCPLCLGLTGKGDTRGSLSLSMETGFYSCFKCGSKGRLDSLGSGETKRAERAPDDRPWTEKPPGFYELCTEPGASALACEPARAYLRKRGLAEEMWAQARIGACVSGQLAGRVVVPILAPDGEAWLGWVGRAWVKKAKRPYHYPAEMPREGMLYNGAALAVDTTDPVLVVEGVFDALSLWPDGVAVLGKPSDAQVQALVTTRRPVAVVLDGDAHEEGEALAMRLRCEGQRAGYVWLPPRMDPDEIPAEQLKAQAAACIEEPVT
jgi:DNA primase